MIHSFVSKYLSFGLAILPVKPGRKEPATKHGFKDASKEKTQEKIWRQSPQKNVGIATGVVSGISVVDVDPDSGGEESLRELVQKYGLDINTVTVSTPRGGKHFFYKDNLGAKSQAGVLPGVDIRGNGGYIVAAPSLHPNGKKYYFEDVDFLNWTKEDFEKRLKEFPHDILKQIKGSQNKIVISSDGKVNQGYRFEFLRSQAGKFKRSGISKENAKETLYRENIERCNPPKTNEEVDKLIEGIFNLSDKNPLLTSPHTDLGNAERIVYFTDGKLKFASKIGKWFWYDGKRFSEDDGTLTIQSAKAMVRHSQELAADIPDNSIKTKLMEHLKKSESRAKIQSFIALAQSESSVSLEMFDSNPILFNVMNGTIDLRDGTLKPHSKENLISKISNIRFEPSATCPRFSKFLEEVFNKDIELIRYFQRVVGYSMTGLTSEQCLFIFSGSGSNGKSTLITILKLLFGEYCRASDISTFTFRKSEQIRNDLARLYDARCVTSVEVQEGKYLDESIIKQVTGGDVVASRFLFKEYFEYVPKWKLFLAVNHLPHITGTDKGIWRRLKVIPFDVSFENQNKDVGLLKKLEMEISGILNWAIEGCIMWQREGLQEPQKITDALESYRSEEDTIGTYIEENLEIRADFVELASDLYAAYAEKQKSCGQRPISSKQFGHKLKIKGFKKTRNGKGRVQYLGLRLRPHIPLF